MAASNHERVGRAVELLRDGLRQFVEREFEARYADQWPVQVLQALRQERDWEGRNSEPNLDAHALLVLIWNRWEEVFRSVLGRAERSLVSELRDARNRWAHQEAFSTDDAYRALDSAARLLTAISAPEADEIERMKMELLRVRFDEQVRSEKRKTASTAIESQAIGNLAPWREVVSPHK